MSIPFCPGYAQEPFRSLVESYPDSGIYPATDFRVEWGPVFHRGRLNGAARVLILGQDPAQHEVIARRILIGTAGRRVQGFVKKLGVGTKYVMVNAFLYSVYGQNRGAQHIDDVSITEYRNRWIQAIFDTNQIEAVISFGSLADKSWKNWLSSPEAKGRPEVPYRKLAHPTSPEAQDGDVDAAVKAMLRSYNNALGALREVLGSTGAPSAVDYGDSFKAEDLPAIPPEDLPAGSPAWMGLTNGWAIRQGDTAQEKRYTIQIISAP